MNYSYLVVSAVVAIAGLAAALAARENRWFVLASGALAAPAGLADGIFVPEYWLPQHVFGPFFSLEGMMFSFGNGCIIAAIVLRRYPRIRLQIPNAVAPPIMRLTTAMMIGFGAFLLVWEQSIGQLMIMHAAYLGFAAMLVFLWRRGWFQMDVALFGGLGFGLVYALEVSIWYRIDPDFAEFWANGASYLYRLPFPPGIPVEELLWAVAYGALWSNLMLYGFRVSPFAEAKLKAPGAPGRPER